MITLAELLSEEDITGYEKVGGQLGSNPGGIFQNRKTGVKHYAKFYDDDQQSRSEVVAGKLYNDMGAKNLNPKLVRHNGRIGVATKWRDDLNEVGHPKDLDQHQLAKHFVAAVITKNWDAHGLSGDNTKIDPKGIIHNTDLGGVFRFRAMGGSKEFGKDIGEHDSLRERHPSSDLFGELKHEHIRTAVRDLNLTYHGVLKHFKRHGVADPEMHTVSVMGRVMALKDKYGV
jgi:hypothetical protein